MPPDTSGTVVGDPVIDTERAHLARSREFLRLMRENVLALSVNPMAGDPVSLEFLKADLYRRAEALKDLPDAPLFFGRLDYQEAPWDAELAGALPRDTTPSRHSTSGGGTSPTRPGHRSSSTGGHRCRGPSTAPAR